MADASPQTTPVSQWALGLLLLLVTGLGGGILQSLRADSQALTGRVTALETDARGQGVRLDEMREASRRVEAKVDTLTTSIASLTQLVTELRITAAREPQRK